MPMRTGTTSSNSMARNSPASAPGQGSRISPIHIFCIPDKRIGESKSLKLYLFSCRNHGAFHEDCASMNMDDLIQLPGPRYIEVWGLPFPGRAVHGSQLQLWPARYGVEGYGPVPPAEA